MVCLFCQCLNVTVHCKDKDWKTNSVSASQLLPEGSKDRLVASREPVYEVVLDVAGVFAEHMSLLVSRTNGDWIVHSCSNCDTDVYISHVVKENKNYVTGNLMTDAQTAKSRKDYSQVFKIIVKPRLEDDLESYSRKRVSSMSFGREDPVMKKLHEQMKSFLNKEQQAMEERVRKFEEEQKETFSQLQKKTHSERTSLFSSIAKARENVISDAIRDSMTITTHTYTEPTRMAPLTTIAGTSKPTTRGKIPSPTERKVTITLSDSVPISVQKVPSKEADIDDPAMFSLDGFDEGMMDEPDGVAIATGGGVAFPQSDDEEISTDDSSFRDVSDLTAGGVAMSMPLGIPMYVQQREDGANDQAVEERRFDPNHVGNSIKALALSVQDTSLFGELPRPRMHQSSHRKW